jgi:hypothetical protein
MQTCIPSRLGRFKSSHFLSQIYFTAWTFPARTNMLRAVKPPNSGSVVSNSPIRKILIAKPIQAARNVLNPSRDSPHFSISPFTSWEMAWTASGSPHRSSSNSIIPRRSAYDLKALRPMKGTMPPFALQPKLCFRLAECRIKTLIPSHPISLCQFAISASTSTSFHFIHFLGHLNDCNPLHFSN